MKKDKINQMIGNFSKKYGFYANLNAHNMCNILRSNSNERLNIEYIENSDRVIIYTYLFSNSEQQMTQQQINLVIEINGELFAQTGGFITMHATNKMPILCWGCDVDILQETDFHNVLENISELTNITREKLNINHGSYIKFKNEGNEINIKHLTDAKYSIH